MLSELAFLIQAHSGLWTHHTGERFQLPEGLSAQGPGRCQCGDRLSSQVRGRRGFETLQPTRQHKGVPMSVCRWGGVGVAPEGRAELTQPPSLLGSLERMF